ncbi:ABC-2 type transport system ATP-binding protein [Humibacillus xanthopallidus]|uniref:ABC-2 type transport system ATP-binding protein n=1 Tax=Humibacillus xanthopallidus TaxID=412689 RepID=A0A543PQ17_9MICO|nr:ATP-binding cassette domain-containing protein [Humibacillus xanthopallidus]TQN46172.1 ABC-2 type transport system ATP-binding protein [Humibacillus xanthopallidus]
MTTQDMSPQTGRPEWTDLEVRGLRRDFGEVRAVDGVSFRVPAGALTGFVGGNGAGKTTTMRMVMGVLSITAGEVLWGGRPITQADRRQLGYMPEERGLYPKQPVLDQLIYLGRLRGMSTAQARTSVMSHLERLGLADRSREHVEKLSLGNQQRVQIIAALMGRPRGLVLDEPFSGLDPEAVDSMADLLREHTSRGVPVLFSSHQLDLVERLCEHLVVLARGKVVSTGTPEQLRSASVARHRLVLSGDAGWVRDLAGIHTVDIDGGVALLELLDPGAERALLTEALRRGEVHEFSPQRPSLAQIYREVTA